MSERFKPITFARKLPTCPKCGGKTIRFYCTGEVSRGVSVLSPCWDKGEHFDVNCQECGYEFYQQVRQP
jgi:hypothetical protein